MKDIGKQTNHIWFWVDLNTFQNIATTGLKVHIINHKQPQLLLKFIHYILLLYIIIFVLYLYVILVLELLFI